MQLRWHSKTISCHSLEKMIVKNGENRDFGMKNAISHTKEFRRYFLNFISVSLVNMQCQEHQNTSL
jgi:hypothetical protein